MRSIKLGDSVAVKIVDGVYEKYEIIKLTKESENMLHDEYDELFFNKNDLNFTYMRFADHDEENLYDVNCENLKSANKKWEAYDLICYIQRDIHKIRINDDEVDELIKDLNNIRMWF